MVSIEPDAVIRSVHAPLQEAADTRRRLAEEIRAGHRPKLSSAPTVITESFRGSACLVPNDSQIGKYLRMEIDAELPVLIERACVRMREQMIHRRDTELAAAEAVARRLNDPIGAQQ